MSQAMEVVLPIERLRELANDAPSTLGSLAQVLSSLPASEEHMEWASEALENCGAPGPEAVAVLIPFLAHADIIVSTWACKLLARLGEAAMAAQAALVTTLKQRTDALVREEAARALGEIGNLSDAARAALEEAAASGGPRLKRLAAAALGR